VWEIKQRIVLDMAADRGAYIDQSQSLNIHMVDATTAKLSSMHFHGWQLGLKTGMYYLRTKAAADAIKFTVEVDQVRRASTVGKEETAKEDSLVQMLFLVKWLMAQSAVVLVCYQKERPLCVKPLSW